MNDDELSPEQLVNLLSNKQQRYDVIVALVGGITSEELRHVTVTPEVKEALINGLQHENSLVRWWCIQLMDHLADESYIEPLLDAAQHDPLPKNRRHAIHALTCELCKPNRCKLDIDLRPMLAGMVIEDADWSVKRLALQELIEIVGPDAVWDLLSDLPGEDHATLRGWVHTQQARNALRIAVACARGVPGWRGRLAGQILNAADQLLQAGFNLLGHDDFADTAGKLHAAQQHLTDAIRIDTHDSHVA